jgi:hypothetical protein
MLEIRNAHGTQCYVRVDEFDERPLPDHDPFEAPSGAAARPAKRGRKPKAPTAAARTLAAKPRPQFDAGEDW